jgi:hypothetical protein
MNQLYWQEKNGHTRETGAILFNKFAQWTNLIWLKRKALPHTGNYSHLVLPVGSQEPVLLRKALHWGLGLEI